jgi:uncharacterized protein (DUF4415 family)
VSFAVAPSVFEDPYALTSLDVTIDEEDRWLTCGIDSIGRILLIVWTERSERARLFLLDTLFPGRDTNMRKREERGYDLSKASQGALVRVPKNKTRITIRIDQDILDWFWKKVDDAGGGNYQTLMNDALRQYVESEREPLETTLRRVIREEHQRAVARLKRKSA